MEISLLAQRNGICVPLTAILSMMLFPPHAVSARVAVAADPPEPNASSSSLLPDAPSTSLFGAMMAHDGAGVSRVRDLTRERDNDHPFSAVGVAFTSGLGGVGIEVATPLSPKLNWRAGVSFLNAELNGFTVDNFGIAANLQMRSVHTTVDWFPAGRSFHISPGVTLMNGNNLSGTATVPAGSTISFNNTNYSSAPGDPLIATFGSVNRRFGNMMAPSLTVGFGNLVTRERGRHWTMPFDFGVEYIGAPQMTFSVTGSACNAQGCSSVVGDPATQANVAAQQGTINQDLRVARFFPVLQTGIGYTF